VLTQGAPNARGASGVHEVGVATLARDRGGRVAGDELIDSHANGATNRLGSGGIREHCAAPSTDQVVRLCGALGGCAS